MAYTAFFEGLGFLVDAVPEGSNALAHLSEKKPDIVIADETTPGFDACDFLEKQHHVHSRCKTIIITPEPVVDNAVNLMKNGALDYLIKPLDMRQLELCVRRGLCLHQVESKNGENQHPPKKPVTIITRDQAMQDMLKMAEQVADSSASVLIQGESGTGKELFARFIHEKSDRSSQPFVAVNCAALPENLLESELFGHEKGAFTGAVFRKIGKFELAHKGTLFLDEITEMQYHLQSKLLRVLQERTVDRVGGTQSVAVDVRIIATTNRNARQAVENNDFRQDLFYRLNTIPILIPPLRNRISDIKILCDFLIKKYCRLDRRNVKGMTDAALSVLTRYPFYGNVRELENIIHRAVLLTSANRIRPEDLMMDDAGPKEENTVSRPEENLHPDVGTGSLKEMEQKMIFKTLDQTEGNRTHAAKILGVSVRTLRNKLKEYKQTD
jgi:two-component system response regulator FlrC